MTDLEKLLAEVTPGDWKVVTPPDGIWPPRVFSGSRIICMVDNSDAQQIERESNARLIAMAPTLARKVLAAEKIIAAYKELLTTVVGECPSLVDEDSGGSAVLINLVLDADEALSAWEAAQ